MLLRVCEYRIWHITYRIRIACPICRVFAQHSLSPDILHFDFDLTAEEVGKEKIVW